LKGTVIIFDNRRVYPVEILGRSRRNMIMLSRSALLALLVLLAAVAAEEGKVDVKDEVSEYTRLHAPGCHRTCR